MDEDGTGYQVSEKRTNNAKYARSMLAGNSRCFRDRQLREHRCLLADDGGAILKIARALARQAAREDHARQQAGSACNAETCRDLCEVFHRSSE